jgi:hypothetical protein
MSAVRRWYAVIGELNRMAKQDPSVHIRVNFPLASPLQQSLGYIESNWTLAEAIRRQGLSPEEFVSLTVLIGAGWTAIESTKAEVDFVNVNPAHLAFFQQHKKELRALDDSLTLGK